ncbi:MAG: SIMPL domain-containing protein [Ruminococcus sp.]|uniref:SIMPL domain-containing protein n=1 Tax=Ruminococcus sp. TaxID=41978 RepID=UPI0025FABE14|nr:SIMPL domain-containing protein [Ruminococcus sp.]MBR5684391.1 SIMPL domain-containing protein [Ruminococcus sp.]
MASVIVKGSGSVSVKPDLIRLELDMQTRSSDCGEAMDKAENGLAELIGILETEGFEREDLKTSDFNVHTEYESVPDENNIYHSVFKGYCCDHSMKIEFSLDTRRLAAVLRAVSASEAAPQISVYFTVKDEEAAREELIRLSSANARKKAELLCEASGTKLGKLLKISYDRSDMSFVSQARYAMDMNCLRAEAKAVSIAPDDIKLTDFAEFEWEIL